MRLPSVVAREIVECLLKGEDYRPSVVRLIDSEFLNYVINFFKEVVQAKISEEKITSDWYREKMLDRNLPKDQIAVRSGLNLKTIENARHTQRKEVVIDESHKHYEKLRKIIDELIQDDPEFNLQITLSFRSVSVTLDVAESLVVVNALAVARAAIRGGAWSSAGKQVEKPLMTVLCALHRVPRKYYDQSRAIQSGRETDFYLMDNAGTPYRCEVKLLGKGNPESADAAFARDAKVFVADTISDTMKQELDRAGILWMELRGAQDWTQFAQILDKLSIPHKPIPADKESEWLDKCLNAVFQALPQAEQIRESPDIVYSTENDLLVDLD
jgi:hypothetical protein